jgi:membrane protein required for colicin V production
MAALDYIIIAIVLISAIAGLVRGFLKEVCALVTWVAAVWLAFHLGPSLVPYLGGALKQPPLGLWVGRGLVFIGVLVVGAAVGALVTYLVRLSIFGGLDRLLGLVLGFARGVIILGVAVMLGQSVKLDGENWWKRSIFVSQIAPIANFVRVIAGDKLS